MLFQYGDCTIGPEATFIPLAVWRCVARLRRSVAQHSLAVYHVSRAGGGATLAARRRRAARPILRIPITSQSEPISRDPIRLTLYVIG